MKPQKTEMRMAELCIDVKRGEDGDGQVLLRTDDRIEINDIPDLSVPQWQRILDVFREYQKFKIQMQRKLDG